MLSSTKVHLKAMTREEIPALVEIDRLSNFPAWTEAMFEKELGLPQSLNCVAYWGKKVVGFGIAWVVSGEAQLLEIGIHPKARSRGVGTQIMQSLLDGAAHAGCKVMLLELRCKNEGALKFYERLGFKTSGKRKKFYPSCQNSENEDALLMICELSLCIK